MSKCEASASEPKIPDVLRYHEISERDHRILNPYTDEKLMLLGEVCQIQSETRQLDLACGKGEMLCRWAQQYGSQGVGVDLSEVFLVAARNRAIELGVDMRVRFERADAGKYIGETAAYDVVSCIGATWIGGGVAGTVALMSPPLKESGLLVIGEPFWISTPPEDAFKEMDCDRESFTSLHGTLDRFTVAGLELVEMILANQDSWDRYMAKQWWTIDLWLRANGDHQDAVAMRRFRDRSRSNYLKFERDHLGWGVFVLKLAV